MKPQYFIVKKIDVFTLVEFLLNLEDDGVKYVNLQCSLTKRGDRVNLIPHKGKKSGKEKIKKIKITDSVLEELLKNT